MHEDRLNSLSTAKEVLNYIKSLNLNNKNFDECIIPELQKIAEFERFYGNSFKSAIDKLKKMSED